MKLTISVLLLLYTSYCLANQAWFSKILSRGRVNADSEEFEDDEDEEEDEDDEGEESVGLFEKGLYFAKRLGVLGISGTVAYSGYKLLKSVMNSMEKAKAGKKDFSTLSTVELLADLHSVGSEESIQLISQNGKEKDYICILFDCGGKVSASSDLKARMDYFTLMSNLTTKASSNMKTIYIPGEKNSHIVEKNSEIASHWLFVPSKSDLGLQKANELRKRFGVRPEELRIVMLGPDLKVISDNALDLLRLDPKGMPWPQRHIQDVLGTKMLGSAGGDIMEIPISGKKFALYFSASWCKPCTTFLPILTKAYKKRRNSHFR